MSTKKILGVTVACCLAMAALVPTASACQKPPQIPCNFELESPVVNQTDPFTVYLTITNFPVTAPFPPPFMDDMDFSVQLFPFGQPTGGGCFDLGRAGDATLDPASYTVQLDEACRILPWERIAANLELFLDDLAPGLGDGRIAPELELGQQG